MSEFDDRLRAAMRSVGDQAQVADLLDRSLRTSHVVWRRRVTAAVLSAAVIVAGIGVGGWAISIAAERRQRRPGDHLAELRIADSFRCHVNGSVGDARACHLQCTRTCDLRPKRAC